MGMRIVAKFVCESVRRDEYENEHAAFRPAHGPGNEAWSKATPGGKVEMMISNPGAQGWFEPGKSYMLTFEPAAE
jgi:hypothetical protein